MKTINNLILFLALSLPKFFLISDLSIQRPLLIILILINIKTITYQIINNKNIFYYLLFVWIYIVSISDLFNERIALDLIRLTVNISAIWFIYFKTKKEYLYFSNCFCYLTTFFLISYILQIYGIDLYLWDNISPKELAGARYFGTLQRVSLAYSPKSGSVLYLGIFMYFYYVKYET